MCICVRIWNCVCVFLHLGMCVRLCIFVHAGYERVCVYVHFCVCSRACVCVILQVRLYHVRIFLSASLTACLPACQSV